MDTDSFYLALASENIDDRVKEKLRKKYAEDKLNWLAVDTYSERTPGLFKP